MTSIINEMCYHVPVAYKCNQFSGYKRLFGAVFSSEVIEKASGNGICILHIDYMGS